jgi:hypothetical protein
MWPVVLIHNVTIKNGTVTKGYNYKTVLSKQSLTAVHYKRVCSKTVLFKTIQSYKMEHSSKRYITKR